VKTLASILAGLALCASAANACDLCSVYASLEAKESARGWFGGAFEQFTHFGTLKFEGETVPNPGGQKEDSSNTQLFVGYQFTSTFGVQANLPYLHRSFRRPEGGVMTNGTETGLGDSVVLAHWRPVLHIEGVALFSLSLLGGVKLPTGSSDRLAEELAEGSEPEGSIPSAIHGHDLALGSGSVDGLVGFSAFSRYRRGFANVNVQYSIRTQGDFKYRYANDLNWSVSPGFYLSLNHEDTAALGVVLSGEHKGQDELHGIPAEDTAIDAVYLGPQFTYSRSTSLYLEAAADFPLRQHNSALQAVPDYRLRIALTWHP
jgi:hypothetical protein